MFIGQSEKFILYYLYMEDYTREFSHLVDIHIVNTEAQRMFINGEEQVVQQKQIQICCPSCKSIIISLDQQVSMVEARRIVDRDAAHLYTVAKYCPHCGVKLAYERPIVSQQ